jgi:L-asparaginase
MRDRVYQEEAAGYAERRPRVPAAKYATDKRLVIIGTGGTIGMSEIEEGMVRPGRTPEWVYQAEDLFGRRPTFEAPFNPLDSANVGPSEWTDITRTILARQGDYDGVVVSHGTDTLAFSASAVAFALGKDLSFPVVFTGSQTTSDVLHGDAVSNILRALLVATQDLPEVVVLFGERIFRATRTQKKDDLRFDAFESPGYPELGFVAEEVQIFRRSLLPKAGPTGPLVGRPTEFSSGILHIAQMPGSEAAFYEAAIESDRVPCRGVIISSLGAGNLPNRADEFNLITLIDKAKARSIPVFLTSQYPVLPANYLRYSTSSAAVQAGAIPTGNMTVSAVVAKLSWIIPQVDREIADGILADGGRAGRIEAMMSNEYVGEGGLAIYQDESPRTTAPGDRGVVDR